MISVNIYQVIDEGKEHTMFPEAREDWVSIHLIKDLCLLVSQADSKTLAEYYSRNIMGE